MNILIKWVLPSLITLYFFLSFFVFLSLQMKEMKTIINGVDLNSKNKRVYKYHS